MERIFNFSAGPSMLPLSVLKTAQSQMLNYKGSGQSVMEMSHRSKHYQAIIDECSSLLRKIMNVPENYEILFLQGGASSQFAMVPLNLTKNGRAAYVLTGIWAKKAFEEAKKYTNPVCIATSEDKNFSYIPKTDTSCFDGEFDYLHICLHNTIFGTRYTALPESAPLLVGDASSCILADEIDVSRFGLLYAGAQKNMAPAGLPVAFVRKDLLGNALKETPTMFNYKIHADNGSMYNTPPCYTIYMCLLVLKWLDEEIGGISNMAKINRKKAGLLYDFLDSSSLFTGTANKADRSLTNVPFVLNDPSLDSKFLTLAEENGLINLKGHRLVGGMRASLYNGMPIEGVERLVSFMQKFEKENSK